MYFVEMKYEGYDKKRDALRYGYNEKTNRLIIKEDERVFNVVARNSKKFKRLYNERTSVERYNGRMDRDYEFEKHTIRGLKKIRLMITISNIIMMVMGKIHVLKGQENYASLLHV